MRDPDYSPEMAGRLGKLEAAISKQRTVKLRVLVDLPRRAARARAQPATRSSRRTAPGTSIGEGPRATTAAQEVPRLAHPRRHPLRHAARARLPPARRTSTSTTTGAPALAGRRRARRGQVEVRGDTAWWVARTLAARRHARGRRLRDRLRDERAPRLLGAAPERPRDAARARASCAATSWPRSPRSASATRAAGPGSPRRRRPRSTTLPPSASAGPVAPERFGVLQALLAHLLAACGDEREASSDAHELADRFQIPLDQLDEHLPLLNLVNFGGGCYTVYAELRRRPRPRRQGALRRRLPPAAAADAARGARDPARARVRRADDRRRLALRRSTASARKLEETFGQFELAQTPEPQVERARGGAGPHPQRGDRRAPASSRSST